MVSLFQCKMKTCIITGGNSGIGFDVAKRLVNHNYDVVLACRNPQNGNKAVSKIKSQYPEASVSFMHLDLSSKDSVREFVKCFNKSKKNLQLLINNAGKLSFFIDFTLISKLMQ